jgi:hypothetical protein
MAELYPSEAQLNALSGTTDAAQEVLFIPIGESPYYTSYYKMLYRLLDVARRAGDLRVYKDGNLTFGVRAGKFMDGSSTVNYPGCAAQSLANEQTNYIYLTTDGQLHVNQTGFPSASTIPHIPLASIATSAGSYNHANITDYRGRCMFRPVDGLNSTQANVLKDITATAAELNALHGISSGVTAALPNPINSANGVIVAGSDGKVPTANLPIGATGNNTLATSCSDVTATAAELNALHSHTPALLDSANNTFNGNIKLGTAGNGLYIKTGTNATAGTVTGTGGWQQFTVNTTKVTANSMIFVTIQNFNASPPYVYQRTPGTSFVIEFAGGPPGVVIAWLIVEPA